MSSELVAKGQSHYRYDWCRMQQPKLSLQAKGTEFSTSSSALACECIMYALLSYMLIYVVQVYKNITLEGDISTVHPLENVVYVCIYSYC